MERTVKELKIRFEAAYRLGADHRKRNLPIRTKVEYMADNPSKLEHSLMEDLYFAYGKGYRASVPTPLAMSGGWEA